VGRTVEIPVSIRVPTHSGERLEGTVSITSNGKQNFTVPVTLTVSHAHGRVPVPAAIPAAVPTAVPIPVPVPAVPALAGPPPMPVAQIMPSAGAARAPVAYSIPDLVPSTPVASYVPTPVPAATFSAINGSPAATVEPILDDVSPGRPRVSFGRFLPLLPVAFLALALGGTLVRDLVVKPSGEQAGGGPPAVGEDHKPRDVLVLKFHDSDFPVTFGNGGMKSSGGNRGEKGKWLPSMRFGLEMKDAGGELKKLTFQELGTTNSTCLKIDGKDRIFGEQGVQIVGGLRKVLDEPGEWRRREIPLGDDRWGKPRQGKESEWYLPESRVSITQHVEIVPGQISGDHDTCLVKYTIRNEDSRAHDVGLRFLLDTFIGKNDGVPFLLPGQNELINTKFEFNNKKEIPAFIQARESEDLANPGTVAQIAFKIPGLETPDHVTLGAYPDVELNRIDNRCRQMHTGWEVPVLSIQTKKELNPQNDADSAVTMYWEPATIEPGQKREVGFTYGLGYLAGKEGGGKLALTVGGAFTPDGEVTVTAYVSDPVPGQTLTLNVPEGFELVGGEATQSVPEAVKRTSPVTWKLKAGGKGEYKITVDSSTKVSQSQSIRIRAENLFGG
jgi:hypothetical protein